MNGVDLSYEPGGPTIRDFHRSQAFVRGIMGPIGSAKSTACVIEILKKSQEQWPSADGIRRTRWAIVRNSYPELKSTTIKTWEQWCPRQYGKFNQDSPITHHVKTAEIDMEILFMALDREEDVKKLLSLELTGMWFNEAREIPKSIIDAGTGRVGRYPARNQGGCKWSGIIMDTNPPDDQSWWYKFSEQEVPEGWKFFKQPSGRSPHAENIRNLPDQYYQRIMAGKDPDWIKVYADGEYGYVSEGKPVYSMYRDSTHTAPEHFEPVPGIALTIAADFGLTPAAVIGQKLPDGRLRIFDEFVTDDCGVVRFAESLATYITATYPDFDVSDCFGDPAGAERGADERTMFDIMKEYTGWHWKPAPCPDNDIQIRTEVVKNALNRLIDGRPGFQISPKCSVLRKGFTSGYHYKPVRTANGTQFHDTPSKNKFSHPHDALQYWFLGVGEMAVVLNRTRRTRREGGERIAKDVDYNIFG